MTIRINVKQIIQYLAIYFIAVFSVSIMFVLNQSAFLYGLLIIYSISAILRFRFRMKEPILLSGFLLLAVFFVRMISGGIGLESWLLYSGQFLIVYYAYLVDPEKFAGRFVKMVTLLSIISLGCWLMQIMVPDVLKKILQSQVELYNKSQTYTTTYYGQLLYTFSEVSSVGIRNAGMYSEPGRYQGILHGAIFMLLFMQEYLGLSKKQLYTYLIILFVTVASTQSTTGYLGLFVMLIGFLLMNRDPIDKRVKRAILFVIFALTLFLIYDFCRNGSNSLLASVVIGKLEDTDITDMYSSGGARLRMIELCINSIIEKPWGAGTLQADGNVVSAGVLRLFAYFGVIPGIVATVWLFRPFIKANRGAIELIVFAFVYINLGLAQTYFFYPGLLAVPIVLNHCRETKTSLNVDFLGK